MNKMRLVIAALMVSYASAASAGILDNLFGPKQWHQSFCETEEDARLCGSGCRSPVGAIVEFKINQSSRSVAVKYSPDLFHSVGQIEVYKECEIFDDRYWKCEDDAVFENGDKIGDYTRGYTKHIVSSGDIIVKTQTSYTTITGTTTEDKGWFMCFKP